MTAPIDLRTSTNPADREADALRARVELLESAIDRIHTVTNVQYENMLNSGKNIDFVYRIRMICRDIPNFSPAPEPIKPAAPETPTLSPYARAQVAATARKKAEEKDAHVKAWPTVDPGFMLVETTGEPDYEIKVPASFLEPQ